MTNKVVYIFPSTASTFYAFTSDTIIYYSSSQRGLTWLK